MHSSALAALVRVVVAALVLPLALGGAASVFARVAAGEAPHVCTCSTGRTHAGCPVCNPSHAKQGPTIPAIDGIPCGDGRLAVVASLDHAAPVSAFARALAPAPARAPAPPPASVPVPVPAPEPDTPPPRV